MTRMKYALKIVHIMENVTYYIYSFLKRFYKIQWVLSLKKVCHES